MKRQDEQGYADDSQQRHPHLFEHLLIAFLEPACGHYDVQSEALVCGVVALLERALESRVELALVVEPPSEERAYALDVAVEIAIRVHS